MGSNPRRRARSLRGLIVSLYVTDTKTGEMQPLDLSPLRKRPVHQKVKRVQYNHHPQTNDDAVLLLAGLNLLTLTLVLVT